MENICGKSPFVHPVIQISVRTELAVLSARLEVCILATAFGIQSQLNLPAWLNVFRGVLTVKSCLPSTNVFGFFFFLVKK